MTIKTLQPQDCMQIVGGDPSGGVLVGLFLLGVAAGVGVAYLEENPDVVQTGKDAAAWVGGGAKNAAETAGENISNALDGAFK